MQITPNNKEILAFFISLGSPSGKTFHREIINNLVSKEKTNGNFPFREDMKLNENIKTCAQCPSLFLKLWNITHITFVINAYHKDVSCDFVRGNCHFAYPSNSLFDNLVEVSDDQRAKQKKM